MDETQDFAEKQTILHRNAVTALQAIEECRKHHPQRKKMQEVNNEEGGETGTNEGESHSGHILTTARRRRCVPFHLKHTQPVWILLSCP